MSDDDRVELSPLLRDCSYCGKPALGFYWSKEQGYVGWCGEHVNNQTVEVNKDSFR